MEGCSSSTSKQSRLEKGPKLIEHRAPAALPCVRHVYISVSAILTPAFTFE